MAHFSRTLVVAEAGSQVSFVDEILSEDLDRQTLFSSAVEVFARDGAQVQYVSLQRMGRGPSTWPSSGPWRTGTAPWTP
jgi:Fe-S cluster assembly scaffold protein SufB